MEYAWLDMMVKVIEAVVSDRLDELLTRLVLSLKSSKRALTGFELLLDAGCQCARNAAAWILVLIHLNTLERTKSRRRNPTQRVLPSTS